MHLWGGLGTKVSHLRQTSRSYAKVGIVAEEAERRAGAGPVRELVSNGSIPVAHEYSRCDGTFPLFSNSLCFLNFVALLGKVLTTSASSQS